MNKHNICLRPEFVMSNCTAHIYQRVRPVQFSQGNLCIWCPLDGQRTLDVETALQKQYDSLKQQASDETMKCQMSR